MAIRRKQEAEKIHRVEERKIVEWREWKFARMVEQSKGTPQQQRLVALELSRPWDFTPAEEVAFMLTETKKAFDWRDLTLETETIQ